MIAAGLTFDLLTVVLMGGVIAMIVSTTLMVVDMMPGRRQYGRQDLRDVVQRRLSPGAARLLAQAQERAALASTDPALLSKQLGLDGVDPSTYPEHSATEAIVLPPGAVTLAPRPIQSPLALPPGEAIVVLPFVDRTGRPPVSGPVIDVPIVPQPGDRLSFHEASNLASHLAMNDPDRIVEVIQQWLRNDGRTYEEDV